MVNEALEVYGKSPASKAEIKPPQNDDPNRENIRNDHQTNGKSKFQEFGIDKGKNCRKEDQDGNNIEGAHCNIQEITEY